MTASVVHFRTNVSAVKPDIVNAFTRDLEGLLQKAQTAGANREFLLALAKMLQNEVDRDGPLENKAFSADGIEELMLAITHAIERRLPDTIYIRSQFLIGFQAFHLAMQQLEPADK